MERINLKEKEVFKKEGRGMANVVDESYLLINQVCLEPGQNVPEHQANSNVTLHVVSGEGSFSIGKEKVKAGPGNLLRIGRIGHTTHEKDDTSRNISQEIYCNIGPDKLS